MKKILTAIAILFSFSAIAQSDSLMNTYKDKPISIKVPLKAVVLYANYAAETMTWERRKEPDYYKPLIGSGTKPDSLINITLSASALAEFAIRLTGERYGGIDAINHSIFNNSPAITGYTALFTQVVTIANGAGAQKNAAEYVVWKYNQYSATMTNMANEMYIKGLNWINN